MFFHVFMPNLEGILVLSLLHKRVSKNGRHLYTDNHMETASSIIIIEVYSFPGMLTMSN